MRITNDKTSFQAKINFITPQKFTAKTEYLEPVFHEVPYPWTIETMKTGEKLFTKGIMECISGILTDGKKTAMFHLGTRGKEAAEHDKVKPFDINNIESVLLSKVNLKNENLHGFILGAWDRNRKCLKEIKGLYEKYKIPYSIIADRKDLHVYGRYSLYYDTRRDSLYITNSLLDTRSFDHKFKDKNEIEIIGNNVEYNTYEKNRDVHGISYTTVRKNTDVPTFFKNQFKEVSLCKFDTWG